jgi:hypothetical protein
MDIDYKLPAAADEHREKSMMLLERQSVQSQQGAVPVDSQQYAVPVDTQQGP